MFRAAFLIIAKTWRQPGRPSGGEWIHGGTPTQWNNIQCKKEIVC